MSSGPFTYTSVFQFSHSRQRMNCVHMHPFSSPPYIHPFVFPCSSPPIEPIVRDPPILHHPFIHQSIHSPSSFPPSAHPSIVQYDTCVIHSYNGPNMVLKLNRATGEYYNLATANDPRFSALMDRNGKTCLACRSIRREKVRTENKNSLDR